MQCRHRIISRSSNQPCRWAGSPCQPTLVWARAVDYACWLRAETRPGCCSFLARGSSNGAAGATTAHKITRPAVNFELVAANERTNSRMARRALESSMRKKARLSSIPSREFRNSTRWSSPAGSAKPGGPPSGRNASCPASSSKKYWTFTPRIRANSNNRLAPMRFAPFSYF